MNARPLLRLYPARWRRRYGDEMEALLEEQRLDARLTVDLLKGAFDAHLNPYPPSEAATMTRSRFQLAASMLAALAVLPAAVFFASAIGRQMQPVQHEPSRTLNAIVDAFGSLPAGWAVALLLIGPVVALVLAGLVLVTRLQADATLRRDLAAFGEVFLRLLRRPAFVIATLAAAASLLILVFLLVHSIAG